MCESVPVLVSRRRLVSAWHTPVCADRGLFSFVPMTFTHGSLFHCTWHNSFRAYILFTCVTAVNHVRVRRETDARRRPSGHRPRRLQSSVLPLEKHTPPNRPPCPQQWRASWPGTRQGAREPVSDALLLVEGRVHTAQTASVPFEPHTQKRSPFAHELRQYCEPSTGRNMRRSVRSPRKRRSGLSVETRTANHTTTLSKKMTAARLPGYMRKENGVRRTRS